MMHGEGQQVNLVHCHRNLSIRTTSDSGNPVVASAPDGPHAAIYRAIGTKVRDSSRASFPRLEGVARGFSAQTGGMRLSFNQCSHAFVAFSLGNFRVKARPPERPGDVEFAPPEVRLRKYGKRPDFKEMPE